MSGAASRLGERSAATTPTEAVDQTTPEVVEPSFNRRLARWLPHIISFVLFALAIVVIHRELAPYRPADLFDRLAQIPASAITLALIAAALGYGTLTLFDPLALQYLGKRLPYRRTALASFTGYAFSHNLGLGWLSGGAVRYRLYTAWGLSSLDIGMVLAFNTVTTFLGLGSILALACLGEPDEIAVILRIPQPAVVVLGLALGVAVAGYVALAATRRSPIGFAGWQLDMPRPAIAVAQIALSLLDWALAAAVLYVLLPAGLAFGFMSFVGLFGLANLGGLISNVPGGIGVFEAVVLLAVPDGGASGAVAAALIGYRLIYYLLPLVVAALLLGAHQFLATGELARRVGSWALILAPNLFALIVFVAGIMLLVTGASPTIASRMETLAEVVPLGVIELSHFLGSIAGLLLLLVAWGLRRRLDGAYLATLLILVAGIVFSLLRGLHVEQATVLALTLLALAPCRRAFYRKTALFTERFSSGWLLAVTAVLLGMLWLGFFSHRHVEYSNDLVVALRGRGGCASLPAGGGRHADRVFDGRRRTAAAREPASRARAAPRRGDTRTRSHRRFAGRTGYRQPRATRRQALPVQRNRAQLHHVRRARRQLGRPGRAGRSSGGAARNPVAVPGVVRPPRRLAGILPYRAGQPAAVRGARPHLPKAGRGRGGSARPVLGRGAEEPEPALHVPAPAARRLPVRDRARRGCAGHP